MIPRYHQQDNQQALLPRILAERARRALLAQCERAAPGWEAGVCLQSLKPLPCFEWPAQ